jgi:hypothetical protein
MPKKTKLNSKNPKYRKSTEKKGPVDTFTNELICTVRGVKVYATFFKETVNV